MASAVPSNSALPQPTTPHEHILQLNSIDKDLTALLHSSSLALTALINPSSTSPINSTRKEAFTQHTSHYLFLLSSIDVRLRRNILALEASGIIPSVKEAPVAPPDPVVVAAGAARSSQKSSGADATAAGADGKGMRAGLGALDVGWLNGRGWKGDRGEEAEFWKATRELLERIGCQDEGPESDVMHRAVDRQDEVPLKGTGQDTNMLGD